MKKFILILLLMILAATIAHQLSLINLTKIYESITGWFRGLYEWVKGFADKREGPWVLFILAFAESSFFPIPPDVLLILLCIGSPKNSLLFAIICSIGSIMGGIVGYLIGWKFWELLKKFFFKYILKESTFMKVKELYDKNAFWAVFTAAFTPIPYKVFTIAAGVFTISFTKFFVASAIGRPLRFFLVAGAIMLFGAKIQNFIEKYFDILTFVFLILLVGGFIIIKRFSKRNSCKG